MTLERNNKVLLCGAECRSQFRPTKKDITVIETAIRLNGDEVETKQKPKTDNPVWKDDDSLNLCGNRGQASDRLDGEVKTCFLVAGLDDYGHYKHIVEGMGYAGVAGIDSDGEAVFELFAYQRPTYPATPEDEPPTSS